MFILLFICYISLTCCGLLFIKLGGANTHISLVKQCLSMSVDYKLLIGLISYVISFLLFTIILQKKNLSVIYPLSAGIVNIVSIALGIIVLKEKISFLGAIGVLCIVVGIVLLNVKG